MATISSRLNDLYQEAILDRTTLSSASVAKFLQRLGDVCGITRVPTAVHDVESLQLLPNPQALVEQALIYGYPTSKWGVPPNFLTDYKAERHGVICTLQQMFECLDALLMLTRDEKQQGEAIGMSDKLMEMAIGFLRTPPRVDSPALFLSQSWKTRLEENYKIQHDVINRLVLPQYMRLAAATTEVQTPESSVRSLARKALPNIQVDHNMATAHTLLHDNECSDLRVRLQVSLLNSKQADLWERTGVMLQPANQRIVAFDKPEKKRISLLYLTTPPIQWNAAANSGIPLGLLVVVQLEPNVEPIYFDFNAAATSLTKSSLVDNQRLLETTHIQHLNSIIDHLEESRLVQRSAVRTIIPGFLPGSASNSTSLRPWQYPWVALAAGFGLVKRRHLELMDEAYQRSGERFLGVQRPIPITEAGYLAGMRLPLPTSSDIEKTIGDLKHNFYGLIALVLFHAVAERTPKINAWQDLST